MGDDEVEGDYLQGRTWLTMYASAIERDHTCGVIFPLRGDPDKDLGVGVDRVLLREWPVPSAACYNLTGVSRYEALLYHRAMPRDADGRPQPIGVLVLEPVFVDAGEDAGGARRKQLVYHEATPKAAAVVPYAPSRRSSPSSATSTRPRRRRCCASPTTRPTRCDGLRL